MADQLGFVVQDSQSEEEQSATAKIRSGMIEMFTKLAETYLEVRIGFG